MAAMCFGRRAFVSLALLAALAVGQVHRAAAQGIGANMVYTAVAPCRIFDTRSASNGTNGQLMANVSQTFNVVGGDVTSTYFTGQGGNDGGCNVPGFASYGARVQAVAVNFAVVLPAATGVLQAWPTDGSKPLASVSNFTNAETVLANFVILPVRQDMEGGDITVVSNVRTHLLADVVGYFSSANPGSASNTGLGNGAFASLTTGSENAAVGDQALAADTTGSFNVAMGYQALAANTNGGENVGIGAFALANNVGGQSNVAIGWSALASNTTGQQNTAVGQQALAMNSNGGLNTALGFAALASNTSGVNNTGVGGSALNLNTAGSNNTALGWSALGNGNSGSNNTAVGSDTLLAATGSGNTAVGADALQNVTSGTSNIAIGSGVGGNVVGGANNIYIGGSTTADEGGTIRIGVTQSAAFMAGISGETSSGGIAVLVDAFGKLGTTTSSARFKEDIQTMGEASDALMRLRPVTFHYKAAYDDGSRLLQYGLVAEEVAQIDRGLVQFDGHGQPQAVRYQFVDAMLLNEVQKQRAQIAAQDAEIAAQKQQLAAFAERLARLEAAPPGAAATPPAAPAAP